MIMENLFLTGEVNIGKTTVLNAIKKKLNISENMIGGFLTKAFLEHNRVRGFYIDPINYNLKMPEFKKRIIGYTHDYINWTGVTDTFENFGVEILNYCLKSPFELIIMDELGFFESKAYIFQRKVHEIIESRKKVLGIIKPQRTIFMNSIKNRRDVIVIEITKENRDCVSTIIQDLELGWEGIKDDIR